MNTIGKPYSNLTYQPTREEILKNLREFRKAFKKQTHVSVRENPLMKDVAYLRLMGLPEAWIKIVMGEDDE